MRPVLIFEAGYLLRRQPDLECGHGVVEVMGLGRSHDRARDAGLRKEPGQSDLSTGDAPLFCNLSHAFDDGPVLLAIQSPAELVGLGSLGLLIPGARQAATRQRTPRDDA